MKTKHLFKSLVACMLMLTFFLAPSQSKAQAGCPYSINNNTTCTIKIAYTIFCNNGWYTNSVQIGPNSTYVINCSEFPTGCDRPDIEFNLLAVNGFGFICLPPQSNTVASSQPTANAAGMFPGAPCNNISMAWYWDHVDINP
jgi:hypothetical protein